MRFDELQIEKYGNCDLRRLDLSGAPGLALLYGPNEAGKSTTLEAVVDLLYGIPVRTSRQHHFGGQAMALSARLQLANGDRLTVKRTKGNVRTLTDGAGSALDESVLSSHLGANNRERFTALFGLNHESLRTGGQQLLDSQGDIGRLIVEAGGGLRSLAAEMAELAERADQLYAARRASNRKFYIELDRYNEADKEVKASLLTVDAYEKAEKEATAGSRRLEETRRQLRAVRELLRSLERMARVCPMLHRHDRCVWDLSTYDDLPDLPDSFAGQVHATLAARADAAKALSSAQGNLDVLNARMEAIKPSSAVLALRAEILDAATWGVHVSKERNDREDRKLELAESQSRLDALRRLTGLPSDADVAGLMPAAEHLARVRALAADWTRLNTEARGLDAGIQEAKVRISQITQRQADRDARGFHEPLGFDTAALASLDGAARDLETRRCQARELHSEVERRTKALGIVDVPELSGMSIPEGAAIQAHIDRVTAIDATLRDLRQSLAAEGRRKSGVAADITALRRTGEPPTDEAIVFARQLRLTYWEPVRGGYLDPQSVSRLTQEERTEAVALFEARTEEADSLVDRKSTEAQRAADLNLALQELVRAEQTMLALQNEIQEAEKRRAEAEAEWAEQWPDIRRLGADNVRQKAGAAERAAILQLSGHLRGASVEIERLAAQVDAAMSQLESAELRMGIKFEAKQSLVARIHALMARAMLHGDEYADYRSGRRALDDEAARLDAAERARVALTEELTKWAAEWASVVSALRLKPEVSSSTATETASEWAAAQGILDAIKLTQQRLDGMDRDEKRLCMMIAVIDPGIGIDLPSDVVAASELLKKLLDEAERLERDRSGLVQQTAGLTPALDRATAEHAGAQLKIDELCALAGCSEEELLPVTARVEERDRRREEIRQTEQMLFSSGDQLPIERLREELAGRELDEISVAAEQERERELELQTDYDQALKDEERLKSALEAYRNAGDTNKPVLARESAAAALRQVVSDYLELTLARELIEEAMAAVREEQQDPLLARAGNLFQRATNAAYSGIRADIDEKGNPSVVGVKPGGESVSMSVMSDGTRDQLFLAFRVAAVEQYCAAAEPLPFIADDLLVHFDDERTSAALELLAELGKTTQVLLFTHHVQVRDAAAKIGVRTIDLGR